MFSRARAGGKDQNMTFQDFGVKNYTHTHTNTHTQTHIRSGGGTPAGRPGFHQTKMTVNLHPVLPAAVRFDTQTQDASLE